MKLAIGCTRLLQRGLTVVEFDLLTFFLLYRISVWETACLLQGCFDSLDRLLTLH